MDHFNYKNGQLYAEEVSITKLAGAVGTPFYCYSASTLSRHFKLFAECVKELNPKICYAVKANSNIAVLRVLAKEGCGADVVSEGEIRRAIAAGIAPQKIVFSGVGKTESEMEFALRTGIFQFNVESEAELKLLSKTAASAGKTANYAIRVNPDVAPSTHGKINTGKKESKFGISIERVPTLIKEAAEFPAVQFKGISVHIGSQITHFDAFSRAFKKIKELVKSIEAAGTKVETVDLGGGIGVSYADQQHPSLEEYGRIVKEIWGGEKYQFIFEPGRVIAGNSGIMVSKVIYIKDDGGAQATTSEQGERSLRGARGTESLSANDKQRKFLIVDAGMNDLLRPSLYSAFHDIVPVIEPKQTDKFTVDVVGPVCETGDIFAEQRDVHSAKAGDLVAFRTAGAYGSVMASTYNSRLLIPEVMVNGDKWEIIRRRPSYNDMLAEEKIPEWL